MPESDNSLLAEFSARRSEVAFTALVRQHVHLVFATAMRQVGDAGAAEEITQNVFVALALAAGRLGSHPTIAGWLHQTTLNKSREWLRSELRRRKREQAAVNLQVAREEGDSVWSPLVPLLDEALLELRDTDRQAVILHFLEGRNFQEVGSALGVGEDAARKRVNRCLEQLTNFFRRQGFATPALAAGAPLFALASHTAPAGLAASATTAGLAAVHSAASASTFTLIKGAMKIMAWTKVKTVAVVGVAVILAAGTSTVVIKEMAKRNSTGWDSLKDPAVITQLKSFVAEKQVQANVAGNEQPPEFKTFFAAAQKGDWLAVSNAFEDFRKHAGQYQSSGKADVRLRGIAWEAVKEIWGAFDTMFVGEEKYSAAYANDIINSISPGSVYFGGTDPGRFLITGMQKSQVNGDPFFTLTQNALADGTYLDYLQSMYGEKIYIATHEDLQKCFQDYTEDARRRLQNHQLKPGEDVKLDSNGQIQVSGQVAVMAINGLLTKVIFDRNTNREFYVEESFPLDWMYPYLEPHGLILKINRLPLSELSDEIVQRDHDYWTKYVTPLIGDWLTDGTSVQEVLNFDEKAFLRHDFSGFTGDPRFVLNEYVSRMFSYERSHIADLYVWRMNHTANYDEKARMAREADFAFRQALALCPSVKDNVSRYVDFLRSQHRDSDAALVNGTARHFRNLR